MESLRRRFSAAFALGFAGLLLALTPSPVIAQDEPDELDEAEEPTELEPIEVWVVREKAQARRAETFALFTQDMMRRSEEVSPYEFFKTIPGVNLTQGHALGFGLRNPVAGRIQIRGIGRKAGPTDFRVRGVQLLMDGVPDFSVTHGHPLPDMFSRSYVGEIELIKGPSSVRHGWAQAGAILMRSRDPSRLGSSGYVGASLGSFTTTQNLVDYNYRWGDGFVQLGGAFRRTDGHRPSSETEATDGRIRIAQKVSDDVNLVGSFRGGTNEWEIPGPVGGNPGVGGDNDWWIGDVGARFDVGEHWDLTTKVWRFDADVRFTDDLHEPNEAWGARAKLEGAAWDGGELTLGTDFMNYTIGRGTGEAETIPGTNEVAPYVWASHETATGSSHWIFSGGLRATFNEQFGEDLSPELGIVFMPTMGTSLRARASHGFRAPNPFEFAFGSSQNPDLEATDLWQYELGWNQRVGDYLTFDVVGWIQDGDNMISAVFDPVVQDVRNQNTGAFSHTGLEAQVEARLPVGFYVGVAGVTMDLEDDTALVPLNTLDVWAGYERGPFWTSFDARWATELFQGDDSQNRLPNFVLANAGIGYRLDSGVGLRVRIENLFDEDYELFAGWPMPGTSVNAGVDWAF